ncbi:MAG TPA: CehA/McbA family metallohydrolase [Gaiellaceae bacterium]
MTPFDRDEGVWLRCALHAHTTNSDGDLPPDKLVRHYEWAGYDVVAITDHWVRTVERSTRKTLVIPSVELNAQCGGPEHDAHVLALGLEADPVAPEDEFAQLEDVVAWIVDNGGVPYLAHTYWSGLRTDQWETCAGLLGIEVWNSGCELEIGRGDSTIHWDEALERGRGFFALATDDSHHPGYDSGFAWTMVRAAEKTQEAVLDALRTGSFYGSTGPEIRSVEVDEAAVVVECSPAASVTLVSSRARGARANAGRLGYPKDSQILALDDRGLITHVRLERPYDVPYGRIEVADAGGRRAWTNPLWIAPVA